VQRNLHRDGILAVTEVYEENLPPALASQAVDAAISIAQGLDYVGVLCVEFFVLQDGSLVVNEIAPRPHNSGHYSQNACDVSQFELQVRTMAGLPLTQPRQHSAAVMLNLLGDLWFARGETAQTPPVGRGAGLTRHAPAPVRQDAGQAWPQDGAPEHHRPHGAASARHGTAGGCHPGHRAFLSRPMILDGNDPSAIAAAARALRGGALLGLPTETVYGLAADASSDAAVAQIFAAKGRPSDHPLIVHVADASGITHFAREVPAFAQALVDAFWPGPLTLILPRLAGVATAATGGQDSVGLRCPAHPVAHAVLQACAAPGNSPELGGPPVWGLAAPSANRFGRVSPTTAQHVQDELGEALLVLDGGPCGVGIESTIVDCTRGVPVLLRPGAITRAQIAAACGIEPLSKEELPALTPARLRHAGGPLRAAPRCASWTPRRCRPAWTCSAPRPRTWRCMRARRCAARRRTCCCGACPTTPRPRPSSCLPRCAVSTTPVHGSSGSRHRPIPPTGKVCATACNVPPRPEARRHATR
jgi:tRNA threonylcarbamoyl adenosine modification protein (Sua5/YciO/YrdC/YwlC family)